MVCKDCIYFEVCGDLDRTEHCAGKVVEVEGKEYCKYRNGCPMLKDCLCAKGEEGECILPFN
jgi:hypothetical protein